jgi:hypothetical protein
MRMIKAADGLFYCVTCNDVVGFVSHGSDSVDPCQCTSAHEVCWIDDTSCPKCTA